MITYRHSQRQKRRATLIALAVFILIYAALCMASGVNPAIYEYNTYLLQAQAWLRGEIALSQNYEFLELAVYKGHYYVSFPPVPSIPMVLYTLIWGDNVPGGLFQKLYLAIACLVILSELLRTRRMKWADCVAWAIFFCLASAMLPVGLVGGVWYEAQILAFLFSVSAIVAIQRSHVTLACLLYALSVGCRPFSVCLGPVLLALHLHHFRRRPLRRALKMLMPGLLVGLGVAAAYGAYNYARFDNPFEFGHNYLPEFVHSESGQFSLKYVFDNLPTLLWGPPFAVYGTLLSINYFGFSMFLSCPIFICNLVWIIWDILRHRFCWVKAVIVLMGTINVLLLLMHRTLGGYQFGMRYALELVPFCLAYFLLSPNRRGLTRWESVTMSFGLAFNFLGACLVHV